MQLDGTPDEIAELVRLIVREAARELAATPGTPATRLAGEDRKLVVAAVKIAPDASSKKTRKEIYKTAGFTSEPKAAWKRVVEAGYIATDNEGSYATDLAKKSL